MGTKFFAVQSLHPNMEETEALKFLYAYMPMSDLTDYSTSYYLDNIRQSFETRREMSWGNKIPEMLFRHFVLPIRVNNENLDCSRMIRLLLFFRTERIAAAVIDCSHNFGI